MSTKYFTQMDFDIWQSNRSELPSGYLTKVRNVRKGKIIRLSLGDESAGYMRGDFVDGLHDRLNGVYTDRYTLSRWEMPSIVVKGDTIVWVDYYW